MLRPRTGFLTAGWVLWFFLPLVYAQPITVTVIPESSFVAYTGHHTLHSWRGVSHSISATIRLNRTDPSNSYVDIRIPVESFDSGNPNRDSNMLEVVEVDRFPDVRFVLQEAVLDSLEASTDTLYRACWRVRGALTFHGVTRVIEVPVNIQITRKRLTAHTTFSLKLSDFKIRRPRLLLIPIRDEIDIEASILGYLESG